MPNQSKQKKRQLLSGVKLEALQKWRHLLTELKTVLQHRNLGRAWYLIVHCIGVVGYIGFSVSSATVLFCVFLAASLVVDDVKKSDSMKPVHGTPKFLNLFWLVGWLVQAFFMALYGLFAGFMGWGSRVSKPMHVPGHIIGSIPGHVLPNRTTQFFGYLTIIAVTAYIVQLLFIVYGNV